MMQFETPKTKEEFLFMGMCLILNAKTLETAREVKFMLTHYSITNDVTSEMWLEALDRAKKALALEKTFDLSK